MQFLFSFQNICLSFLYDLYLMNTTKINFCVIIGYFNIWITMTINMAKFHYFLKLKIYLAYLECVD